MWYGKNAYMEGKNTALAGDPPECPIGMEAAPWKRGYAAGARLAEARKEPAIKKFVPHRLDSCHICSRDDGLIGIYLRMPNTRLCLCRPCALAMAKMMTE